MRPLLLTLLFLTPITQAQFTLQQSHTTASLRGIHSLGNGIAWASGTNGTVLRTTDQGKTWQTCPIPPNAEKLDFRGIQAFDANTAIVMSSGTGDLSRLYKTTNACQSWTLLFTNPDPTGFWDAIKFWSSNSGVVLGDPLKNQVTLFHTSDGGEKWIRNQLWSAAEMAGFVRTRTLDRLGASPIFAASNSALVIGDQSNPRYGARNLLPDLWFVTGGLSGPALVHADAPCAPDPVARETPGCRRWLTVAYPIAMAGKKESFRRILGRVSHSRP